MSQKRLDTSGLVAGLFGDVPKSQTKAPVLQKGDGDEKSARAISSLPSPLDVSVRTRDGRLLEIPLDRIRIGSHQPRQAFDEERIKELAESIRLHGLIEPVLVTPHPGGEGYLLIAGERRVRAAMLAARTTVPATVREGLSDVDVLVLSFTENLLREDLSPTERAEGILELKRLIDGSLTDVARRLGYTKARVSQLVGLRRLPQRMYAALAKRQITEKQAQAILRVEELGSQAQASLFSACVDHRLTDAEANRLAKLFLRNPKDQPQELAAQFARDRATAPSQCGAKSDGSLASLTGKLRRIELQMADVLGIVQDLAVEKTKTKRDVKPALEALCGLRDRLREIEGSLRKLG